MSGELAARRDSRDEVLLDLRGLMRSLYSSGDFYVSVPADEEVGFEEGYWADIVDPDGNHRNRLAEREKGLEDLAGELAFVRSLGGGRILDAGCGPGWFLSALGDEWEKHGLEVSEFAARVAQQYAEVHVGMVESTPYDDSFFDVVFCHHVIEHSFDPVAAIVELRRVLRPGGVLILGTPDFDSGAARRYGSEYRLVKDRTHVSLFSNDSMHRFLRAHGFHIDAVDYPYFDLRYFTAESLLRLLDETGVSPAFYGNFMTFYCTRAAP